MHPAFFDEASKLAAGKANFSVSKTRGGRRSMRVDTMLRKEKDGSLFRQKLGGVKETAAVGVRVADGEKQVLEGPEAEQQLAQIQQALPKPDALFRGLQGLFGPEGDKVAALSQEDLVVRVQGADAGAAVKRLLESVDKRGRGGHSFSVYEAAGVGRSAKGSSLGDWDGDGGQRILSVKTRGAPKKETTKTANAPMAQGLRTSYVGSERLSQSAPARAKPKAGDAPTLEGGGPNTNYPVVYSGTEVAIAPKLAEAMARAVQHVIAEDLGDVRY